jgi:hypothetical protein
VLADVVVTDDGFVAVGRAAGQAAAWVSLDGATWGRTGLAGGSNADVVVVGELGVTVFGRAGGTLVTWRSFDGFRWEQVPGGPEVFDRAGDARVVGAHDDGEGYLVLVDRGGSAESWSSPDGRSWEPAPVVEQELLPASGAPRPRSLLGAGSTAVAVGAVDEVDGVDAAVWTSLAGAPWERASPREAVFGGDGAQVALAATQLGADLVVVGTDTDDTGDVDAAVWSTGAGGGWRRSPELPDDGLSGPGDQHAVDLAPTREGALVVGWEEGPDGPRALAWNLVDGEAEPVQQVSGPSLAWQRVPPSPALGGPGEQRLDATTPFDGRLVAVGSSARPDAPEADVDGAVWSSVDGIEWERVAAPGLDGAGDQRLLDVLAAGPGLVAVGSDGSSAAVWTSADGRSWARSAPDEAVFGGPGDQVAAAVVAGPDGSLVVVGSDTGTGDGDAAAWRSTDGGAGWARVLPGGDLGGPGAQAMLDVALSGPVLVAVGQGGRRRRRVVVAGRHGVAAGGLGEGRAEAVAVAPGGSGVVAVGSVGTAGGGLDGRAWRSDDGRSWVPVLLDDGPARRRRPGAARRGGLDTGRGGARHRRRRPHQPGPGRRRGGVGELRRERLGADAPRRGRYGGDQAQRWLLRPRWGDVLVAVGSSGSAPASRDAAVWVTAPVGGGGGVL